MELLCGHWSVRRLEQPRVDEFLIRRMGQHEHRTVLVIGTFFHERRETREDQIFAFARAAQHVTARLSAGRAYALHGLSERIAAVDANAVKKLSGNRRDPAAQKQGLEGDCRHVQLLRLPRTSLEHPLQ